MFARRGTGLLFPLSELVCRSSGILLLPPEKCEGVPGESGIWAAKGLLPKLWLEKCEDREPAGEARSGATAGKGAGRGGARVRRYPRTTWALERQHSPRLCESFTRRRSAESQGPGWPGHGRSESSSGRECVAHTWGRCVGCSWWRQWCLSRMCGTCYVEELTCRCQL